MSLSVPSAYHGGGAIKGHKQSLMSFDGLGVNAESREYIRWWLLCKLHN